MGFSPRPTGTSSNRWRASVLFGSSARLPSLRASVKETLDVPVLEYRVAGLSPLLQHRRNEAVATDSDIGSPDDQVMSSGIFDVSFLVCSDTLVLVVPFGHELSDGSLCDPGEVSDNEPGVLSGKFDLA